MPAPAFAIYGTPDGYVPVTSEVRREILQALEEEDLELPDLAEITGRAKSTLSSTHMKRLLEQGLVEERAHPSDGRRKLYSLRGERLGSSDVPVDRLRDAVTDYVTARPGSARLPLTAALGAVARAPPEADSEAVRVQARDLGEATRDYLEGRGDRRPLVRVAEFLEDEDLARTLRIDLETPSLTLEPLNGLDGPHGGPALGGFVEGLLSADGGEGPRLRDEREGPNEVRLRMNGR